MTRAASSSDLKHRITTSFRTGNPRLKIRLTRSEGVGSVDTADTIVIEQTRPAAAGLSHVRWDLRAYFARSYLTPFGDFT